MCGRATNEAEARRIAVRTGADLSDSTLWVPSYNVAPTQNLPVVGLREGRRVLDVMRWGLVPKWIKTAEDARKSAGQCFNARGESVNQKASFRAAFEKRRVLIAVTGWFEWTGPRGERVPYYFHGVGEDRDVLTLAGLWEAWRHPETNEAWRTCSIVTTEPNAMAARIHDRMPVVLEGDAASKWLAPDTEVASLRFLLTACAEDVLAVHQVAPLGSGRNDASLIERVGAERAA